MKAGYVELTDDQRKQLLEGAVDIVTPEVKKREDFLRQIPCPACGAGPCLASIDADKPFTSAEMLPKQIMICQNCDARFEPYTGIQYTAGKVPIDQLQLASMFVDKG